MHLCVNMLIEWSVDEGPTKIERVLWLEPTGSAVVMFDIEDEQALPIWRETVTVTAALATNDARILSADPYAEL